MGKGINKLKVPSEAEPVEAELATKDSTNLQKSLRQAQ